MICWYLTRVRGQTVSLQESVTGQINSPPPYSASPGLHSESCRTKDWVPLSDDHVTLKGLRTKSGHGDVGGAGAGDQGLRQLHRHPR